MFSRLAQTTPNLLSSLQFESCLGEGCFGFVLKAIDQSQTSTAVKFQFITDASDKEQQQIRRECQLAKECDHENVVKILKVADEKFTARDIKKIFKNITHDEKCLTMRDMYVGKAVRNEPINSVCIQMELCGENLREWMCGGQDKYDSILQIKRVIIVKNIASGLKYLHDKKIIHRDLKPENIMFSRKNYKLPVKIGDFGLCRKIHSDETQTSNLTSRAGSQDYMALEAFTNDYSFQADLYSLGLTIWEVVQLIRSHLRKKMFDRLVNDKDEDLVMVHPTMVGVREMIINLTKRKVKDRIQSIDDVLAITKTWKDLDLTEYECYMFHISSISEGENIGIELMGSKNETRNVCFTQRNTAIDVTGGETQLQLATSISKMSSISSKLSMSSNITPNLISSLKFESCIGQGNFGIVLKASDQSGTSSAVKFLFTTEANDKERQQIIQESQFGTEFAHENVVKILKVAIENFTASDVKQIFKNITDDEKCLTMRDMYVGKAKRHITLTLEFVCIQMELCGENLREWMLRGQDESDSIVKSKKVIIVKNIASGLKYLHDKKIIHGDLKPENIVFSRRSYKLPVKIGDFGHCRKIPSQQAQIINITGCTGTPDYMSPGALTDDNLFQADLFSLGLIIWEVVQLTPLQNKRTMFDRLVNDKAEDLVMVHPTMVGVREIIIKLTKKIVKDRIQSIDHVLEVAKTWAHLDLREFTARNGDELRLCFEAAVNGRTIQLVAGEYIGEFILEADCVRICGIVGTVLKLARDVATCLKVIGNECSISNVAIIAEGESIGIELSGSKNQIRNVNFTGGNICVNVSGDENQLQNLSISNSVRGIGIDGFKNVVRDVKMENVTDWGILVASKSIENCLSDITGRNVKWGILVFGPINNILNVNFIKNTKMSGFRGVVLGWHGFKNSIEKFTCSGYERSKNDWGLNIYGENCSVKDSECGPVGVGRSNNNVNATLTNVEYGEIILIEGDDVKLMNCRGKEFKSMKNVKVTLIDCNFGI